MYVRIGTDHAGFELKEEVVAHLREAGYDVVDHGAHTYDALDDYPPSRVETTQAVVGKPSGLGIVIGSFGSGEQMTANCVKGMRTALVWSDATARLAREHNDASVVTIGARQHNGEKTLALIGALLETPFNSDGRHQRRVDLVKNYERSVHAR